MKKSLIALAVAGAMTAPMIAQADATIYGSLRTKVVVSDESDTSMHVGDNSSRIGLRGSQETGIEGVSAMYRFEAGSSTETGSLTPRLSYVGLGTGAGDFTIGRQWTPAFLMVGSMVDQLDASSNPTHNYAVEGRQSNVVAYTTPKMGGFQAALATIARDGDTDEDSLDAYNLAASYNIGGFRLAASQTDVDDTSAKTSALAASYTMNALYVAALYTDADAANRKATVGEKSAELVATYDVGDNVKLLANFVDFGENEAAVEMGSQYAIEAWYKLGSKARAFANFTGVDSDREVQGEFGSVNLGYRVDF